MKTVIQLTEAEFHQQIKVQATAVAEALHCQRDHPLLVFQCPACQSYQSGLDLMKATSKTFQEIETFLGFSCIGRFTHGKPPPHAKLIGRQQGCNWTLGGLFRIHEIEVLSEDGKTVTPLMRLASVAEAIAHHQAHPHPEYYAQNPPRPTPPTQQGGPLSPSPLA